MKVKFIGTGSAFSKSNWNTSALVYFDNNNGSSNTENNSYNKDSKPLLIDCGWTIGRALWDAGIKFSDIGAIVITHTHGDHVGGLEELVYSLLYLEYNGNLNLFLQNKLKLYAWVQPISAGLHFDEFGYIPYSALFKYGKIYDDDNYFEHNNTTLNMVLVEHINGLRSVALEVKNKFFYTGDTKFDKCLIEKKANNVQIIFHDCEFSDNPTVHATFNQLKTLPKEIKEKIVLMHYNDNWIKYSEEIYDNGFRIAHQGQEFIIENKI